MSKKIIDECPANPSSYDYHNNELYPLELILFVGNYVYRPYKSIDLIKRFYGENDYLIYPRNEYERWLKFNSNKLFLLNCPFQLIPEVEFIDQGLKLNIPFIIRNTKEFHLNFDQLKEKFLKEKQIISWFETKDDLFVEDISKNPYHLFDQWMNNQLKSNVTDSPCDSKEFLPKSLSNRIENLDENHRSHALCYLLTNQNSLTKFHTDIGGYGWVYLIEGIKLWWFISPEHIQQLEQLNYPIESLRELSFTQLVFIHQNFLWGKIYVVLIGPKDFISFPEHWAHRVVTYDKAFGIGDYTK